MCIRDSLGPGPCSDGAESHGAFLGCPEVDVADRGHRDDHATARVVDQVEQAAFGQRLGHQGLDLLRGLLGLHHDLARDVLHADLDLHGKAFPQNLNVLGHLMSWDDTSKVMSWDDTSKANPRRSRILPARSLGSRPTHARTTWPPAGPLRRGESTNPVTARNARRSGPCPTAPCPADAPRRRGGLCPP